MRNAIKGWLTPKVRGMSPVNDIPPNVTIGINLRMPHSGIGVVINQHTVIGNNVSIFPNVVVGRFDANIRGAEDSTFERVVIEDDVIIYANAVIVGGPGVTTIGRGSIIGAGAVVVGSTGFNEVWVGNPARLASTRAGWKLGSDLATSTRSIYRPR